ncbi:transcriptional regulator [Rhizobium sp. NFR12]|uniref:HVO_A0114 family putative DNA-binding protein n=1 Tax=Rhizobium sp. NFR12 TaxID=1566261 RepID=UPI0008A769C4|nr:transcriptional regulator [Rhizobium sp. NFR12]SEH23983.1 Predicted transcriptional regulator [Rhizobium sp. NFR12]
MTTLKVKIQNFDSSLSAVLDAAKAAESDPAFQAEHILSFPTWDMLHRVLAPKRLEIVQVLTAQAPMTIREVARRVGRDFKGVHGDVTTLLNAGVIEKAPGGVVFPYDRIHLEFDIAAAA